MKGESFRIEVIISAFLTTIIYGIQLFLSIRNFRKSMGDLYDGHMADREQAKKLKKRDIVRKSTQYPSYLLLYLLGGFFICFHLILLLSIIIKEVIEFVIHTGALPGTIGYILPILVLYGLQKIIIYWAYEIINCTDKRDFNRLNPNDMSSDFKLNILDSMILYLKLISCKTSFSFIKIYSIRLCRFIHRCCCVCYSFDF
jgi:hypothetical protein